MADNIDTAPAFVDTEQGVNVMKNISYGPHERNILDLYIPEKPLDSSAFILIIHGGGWVTGDKSAHDGDCAYWSSCGYVCANMNYRYVSSDVNVFDELDDVSLALKKVKETCAEHGISPSRVLITGGSAGAHLSLLYAYTRAGSSPVRPFAVAAFCPPVDFTQPGLFAGLPLDSEEWKYGLLSDCCSVKITPENRDTQAVQEAFRKVSPLFYISSSTVPTAVFHGRKDDIVPFTQAAALTQALEKHGIKNDLLVYEESGHALDRDPGSALKAKEIMKKYLSEI